MVNISRFNRIKVKNADGAQYCTFPYVFGKYSRVTIEFNTTFYSTVDESGILYMGSKYASSSVNPSLVYGFGVKNETGEYSSLIGVQPIEWYDGTYTRNNNTTNTLNISTTSQERPSGVPGMQSASIRKLVMDQYSNGEFYTNWELYNDNYPEWSSVRVFTKTVKGTSEYAQNANDYSNSSLYPELHYISEGHPYVDELYVCHVPTASFSDSVLSNGYFALMFYPEDPWDEAWFDSVKFEEFNPSTNQYELFDEYTPCTCDGSTGFINTLNNIFVPFNGEVSFVPEDEFKQLFPYADIRTFNKELYTGNMGPLKAYKAVGTLSVLQAVIDNKMVYIGELISVLNDGNNNGLYHIVQGNNGLTYKKLSFA